MSINNVIKDYCIGCGNCSIEDDSAFRIELDDFGMYKSIKLNDDFNYPLISKICPFTDESLDENQLSSKYFNNCNNHNGYIGYYDSLYAGHVQEGNYRSIATSGGIISWILCELKRIGNIDYVIHVKESKNKKEELFFKYSISETNEEILSGAKSRYYPIEMSEVMKIVQNTPGNYAFVGLPCFVKAVRLLINENEILAQRIKYCIGIVCGHLKSTEFSKFFGWQVGIRPTKLEKIDFRVKLENNSAGDYGVYLKGDNKELTKPTQEFFGFNWRNNFFRNPACNYCDDVFAETADIVVGDAWLPEYINDPKGNSIVAVRSKELDKLIQTAIKENRLSLDSLIESKFIKSQAGGIRDRREGLAYRLFLKEESETWVPKKRVQPSANINEKRKKIYKLRMKMENLSHIVWQEAVKNNSYLLFENRLKLYVDEAAAFYKVSLLTRMINLIFNTIKDPIKMYQKLKLRIKGIK